MWKKYISFALAVVITGTTLYVPALATPVNNSSETQAATLGFIKQAWDTDKDTERTTMVAGSSVGVNISIKNGYEVSPESSFDYDAGSGGTPPAEKDIEISGGGGNGPRELVVSPGYPAEGHQTVLITGNYYTTKGTGWARETINGSAQTEIITSVEPAKVMQFGRIVLKCVQGEDVINGKANGGAIFTIEDATDGLSIYKTGATVAFSRLPTGAVQLQLNVTGADDKKTFTFAPSRAYSYFKSQDGKYFIDSNGNRYYSENDPNKPAGAPVLGSDGNPPVKTQNDAIQEGEKIELILRKPVSNSLSLTVYAPKAAVEDISALVRSDTIKNPPSQFIQLTGSDEISWITGDFKLRQRYNDYNTTFSIDWKWTTKNSADEKVVSITKSNGEWTNVRVNRTNREDVKGKLTYTVTYTDREGKQTVSDPVDVSIVVKGTGTPPKITMTGKWIHTQDGPCTSEDVDKVAVPDEIPDNRQYKMDVFKGGIPGYDNSVVPYRYEMKMEMGAVQSYVQYMMVDVVSGNADSIVLQMNGPNGKTETYVPGSGAKYVNPSNLPNDPTQVTMLLSAANKGTVKLKFRFFIGDAKGKPVELTTYQPEITFNVADRSPSNNSALSVLAMKNHEGRSIDFGFQKDKTDYTTIEDTIHLPYSTKYITLEPSKEDPAAQKDIKIEALDINDKPVAMFERLLGGTVETVTVESGKSTPHIVFNETNAVRKLRVTVTAQNPNIQTIYTLHVVWDPASTDSSLKTLGLYSEADALAMKNNLIKNFDPLSSGPYVFSVPYHTKYLKVKGETNSPYARELKYSPELTKQSLLGPVEWLDLSQMQADPDGDGYLKFVASVLPEDTSIADSRKYEVHIYREPPSKISTLKELKVSDAEDKALTYEPGFKADTLVYTMDVPYSTGKIKLTLKPTDERISNIQVYSRNKENLLLDMSGGKIKPGAATPAVDVLPIDDEAIRELGYHSFLIVVTAEDEKAVTEYELRVQRAQPNDDAQLKSLVLKDQDGGQIKTFAFHPDETSYTLSVPFETTGISFTPTSNDPNAVIRINEEGFLFPSGTTTGSGMTSKVYKLKGPGEEETFEIVVTAENGRTEKTYAVKVTRGQPSSDARLKKLEVSNVDEFTPLFISSKTSYKAVVSEGAPGVVITATANHPGATIRINGNVVASGQPSALIELIEIKQKIEIEVTAQDGTTKMVYTIEFTNENLIEKTSNADLRSLTVNDGQMTPNFKPAITKYEVAVTEKTYSVDIIPRPADPLATMRVMAGSKEIGDYDGNYSQALEDGENEITIEVTSPDKTVTKDYTLLIYRNEEDKLKNLTPLEADDIDFENSDDVILVMIDEYPRVSADVFEELKEYPKKTIVFQGNDYSLEFKASDLKRVIPQAKIYDFRMYFTSPEEEDIYDIMDEQSRNDDIINRAVMIYFPYHGSLPGPATFHLSLGRKYSNDMLYWHYYNMERDRIDYYGSLKSNNKGNIALTIDHFSTYILTPQHRIAGSEDKAGKIDALGQTSENSTLTADKKVHPYTGTQGEGLS